jgi:hypothetical protein
MVNHGNKKNSIHPSVGTVPMQQWVGFIAHDYQCFYHSNKLDGFYALSGEK